MRQIDIEDETIDTEGEGWKEFRTNGGFEVRHGNGLVDRFQKLMFGWTDEDYYVNSRAFVFYAGYQNQAGNLSDSFNIPADVFEELFPNDKAEWNSSESSHDFECPPNETVKQSMERVRKTLLAAGFDWEP